MDSIKIFDYRRKSEDGFVLIAAIMAVMIILAVSFFILTTSTQDIRISSRMVAERKALSAAEACGQALYASTSSFDALIHTSYSNVQIDPADPSVTWSASTSTIFGAAIAIGYDLPSGFSGFAIYESTCTGKDSSRGSSVSLVTGMIPPPAQVSTVYGNAGAGGG